MYVRYTGLTCDLLTLVTQPTALARRLSALDFPLPSPLATFLTAPHSHGLIFQGLCHIRGEYNTDAL